MGLVSGLVGFWAGFRSNLWIARRAEWNAVVDRIRAGLLKSRQYDNIELRMDDADLDLLLVQASWRKRRSIQSVVDRHSNICRDYKRDSGGGIVYTEEQMEGMRAERERLLRLVRRR